MWVAGVAVWLLAGSPSPTPAASRLTVEQVKADAVDVLAHSIFRATRRVEGPPDLRSTVSAYTAGSQVADELRDRLGAEGRTLPGFHDDAYWRSVAPAQLAFLARAAAER